MKQNTIDEKVDRDTTRVLNWLNNGGKAVFLRGRLKLILPFDVKFMNGQTIEHNAFSEDGHEWEVAEHGQTRKCTKCFITQCDSSPVPLDQKQWTGFASSNITKEDIHELLRLQHIRRIRSENNENT